MYLKDVRPRQLSWREHSCSQGQSREEGRTLTVFIGSPHDGLRMTGFWLIFALQVVVGWSVGGEVVHTLCIP